jgi:hypothetical protein
MLYDTLTIKNSKGNETTIKANIDKGLAIHKTVFFHCGNAYDGGSWALTHVFSGMFVIQGAKRKRDLEILRRKLLDTNVDFTGDIYNIPQDRQDSIKLIMQEFR